MKNSKWIKIPMYLLLILVAIYVIIPVYALFIATFKEGNELVQHGLNLSLEWEKMNLDNYVFLFRDAAAAKYWMWYKNSIFLTVTQVVLTLLVSACVGYGFAVYDFKLKNTAFIGVLLIMSIPFEILMLPLYTQINDMGLGDRYMAIMLPFLANAATIFFFRQYLSSVPLAIIESGRIDGASEYRIFAKLIVPIMKPAFAAMAILNGMNSWNNFLWPLLALHSDRKYTLPIGLNTLVTPYGNNYDLLIVGSFFSIVPVLILFLLFQKYFIEGMVAGAVKG